MYNSKRKTKNLLSSGTRQKISFFFFFSHSFSSDVLRFVSHVLCCLVCSVIFLLKSLKTLLFHCYLEIPQKYIYQLLLLMHATEAGTFFFFQKYIKWQKQVGGTARAFTNNFSPYQRSKWNFKWPLWIYKFSPLYLKTAVA